MFVKNLEQHLESHRRLSLARTSTPAEGGYRSRTTNSSTWSFAFSRAAWCALSHGRTFSQSSALQSPQRRAPAFQVFLTIARFLSFCFKMLLYLGKVEQMYGFSPGRRFSSPGAR